MNYKNMNYKKWIVAGIVIFFLGVMALRLSIDADAQYKRDFLDCMRDEEKFRVAEEFLCRTIYPKMNEKYIKALEWAIEFDNIRSLPRKP